jgi:hypothetical protein
MLNENVNILEEALGGAETEFAQANPSDVIARLKNDGEFFIEFFLGEALEFPVPDFHLQIWKDLTDMNKERVLLAIPREHAKTTLAKLSVVWHLHFSPKRFCVYLSNTSPIAKNACIDIMEYLKSDNYRAIFGDIKIIKESQTDGLWRFDINLGKGKVKHCILRSAGQGQQMRGINIDNQRPDFAVVDDVEDMENTDSELLQKKLDRWMFGTFLKALARGKKVLWLGNMLRKTSLLSRLSTSDRWNPTVYGCLIPANDNLGALAPLWADLWPIDKLIDDYQEYISLGLLETWMCEMMNMPGVGTNGFHSNQFNMQPVPTPDSLKGTFITIDPAWGMVKSEHDKTAIVVHGILEDGPPMVLSYIVGHMREHEIFQNALRLSQFWNCWCWGIESVAAQKVLITLFEMYSINANVYKLIEFVKLTAGEQKHARISAWVSSMESENYAIPDTDIAIVHQLLQYDMTKRDNDDDLIDSCAYGPQMLENYLPTIYSCYLGNSENDNESLVSSGMEVCSA